jgi:hypothetical protein
MFLTHAQVGPRKLLSVARKIVYSRKTESNIVPTMPYVANYVKMGNEFWGKDVDSGHYYYQKGVL